MTTIDELIRRLPGSPAARGLVGSVVPNADLALPSEPLDDEEWHDLVAECMRQRLEGMLHAAVRGAVLAVTDAQAGEVRQLYLQRVFSVLGLEQMLLHVGSALDEAGIEHRVLKGPAAPRLTYPEPSLRPFVDIDLLVRGEALDPASTVLEALGFRRRFPEPRPGFDARFGKGREFVSPTGAELDLHRTFAAGPYGLGIDLDGVFETSTPFVVAGRTFHALAPTERLLHAAFHAVLGDLPPRLVSLADTARLLDTVGEWPDAVALARSWRGESVLALALRYVARTFELPSSPPFEWAARFEVSRRDLWALRAYTNEQRTYGSQVFLGLLGISGWRSRAAYVRALAFPDGSYLEDRYSNRRDRLRRSTRTIFRATRTESSQKRRP